MGSKPFLFSDSGSSTLLFPLEYVRSSVLGVAAASEAVFENHSYLQAFSDVLKRTGLAGVLGFGIKDENCKGGTMENTPCGERKSYVKGALKCLRLLFKIISRLRLQRLLRC